MNGLLHRIAAAGGTPIDISGLPHITDPGQSQIQSILTIVFTVTGAIAVLMIVIGGLRYITAQGEPSELAKAKNTIIYALIGLVVSICAVAIVTFVIGNVLS